MTEEMEPPERRPPEDLSVEESEDLERRRVKRVAQMWDRARSGQVELAHDQPRRVYSVELKPDAFQWVLDEVVPSGQDWKRAQEALEDVTPILEEAFARAAELAEEQHASFIDRRTAVTAFHEIVEDRYHCPYPLLIC
jgi:hypothetical protein